FFYIFHPLLPNSTLFPYTTLFRSTGGKTPPWVRVEFWSCVGMVLFFFFPWVSVGGVVNLAGYQVADFMRQGSSNLKNENNLAALDRKSTRLNSSHDQISYAVFCLK